MASHRRRRRANTAAAAGSAAEGEVARPRGEAQERAPAAGGGPFLAAAQERERDEVNTTAELLARYFYAEAARRLAEVDEGRFVVSKVEVWENEGSLAVYWEE